MNIMDLVDSLKYRVEDVARVGSVGYVEAISRLMIEGLNSMETTQRPIHCTDAKREKLYIRDDNTWKKDNESKEKLRRVIKVIGHKNLKTLEQWKDEHPRHEDITTSSHKQYRDICDKTMEGLLDDEDKISKKIMKKIVPETIIDKDYTIKNGD